MGQRPEADRGARSGGEGRVVGAVGAQDAVFRWDDPLPFLDQFGVFGEFWLKGQRAGVSAIAASTADIEWNGEIV